MYIKRLVLTDLKGFQELDFSFVPRGWNVLTGDNGSGKTAVLKAIAMALLGPEYVRALQPSLRGWVRSGAKKAEIAAQIAPDDPDKFTTGRRFEDSFWSELDLAPNGGAEISLKPGDRRRRKSRGPLNGPWAENTAGWFAAGYGPFRRLYGHSPDAQRVMSGPHRVARFATMFREDAALSECEIWLKELRYKSLENREREAQILEQVQTLLNDDFLHSGFETDRVDSDGLWLRDAGRTILPLSDMSEGYRAALALMIDILRHLDIAHPGDRLVEEREGRFVVPHGGVVLIDEIDAHLHPAWQREIGFWLKQRFPEVQFIVTTHSALVCQAATDPGGLFHLPPPGSDEQPFQLTDEDYLKIIRSTPDEILLSPAFGLSHTRSPEAVRARQGYARLRAKQKTVGLDEADRRQMKLFEPYLDPEEPVAAS